MTKLLLLLALFFENIGLINGANSRGDWLAAAGPPGAVRVMDSCGEIKLCREISGKAKNKSRAILFSVFFPQPLELRLPPQVLEHFTDSFTEQRRPVMTLLAAVKRRPELSREQSALRTAWDHLEEEVRHPHTKRRQISVTVKSISHI